MNDHLVDYYRILALDGGGMRGLFSAKLLDRLEVGRPGLVAKFDLFAGTSTGGLVALLLASGRSPSEIVNSYEHFGPKIFSTWKFIPSGLPVWFLMSFGLLLAKYGNRNLREALVDEFGENTTLGDLEKQVLITSFDLDYGENLKSPLRPGYHGNRTWKPKFFHNFPGEGSDADELVVDVAMRTIAAPVYFPAYQGYIDGAIAANNPSFVALMQAVYSSPSPSPSLTDIALLSLGTGNFDQFIAGKRLDWGMSQWASRLLEISLDSVSSMTDWQCRKMLEARYHRLNPDLGKKIDLDATKRADLDYIKSQAEIANLVDRVDPEVETLDWVNDYVFYS
jgi:patatin-like phospholipase/acyl hydrolase